MNDDVFKGQWKQFRGEVRKQWNKLTDDDLDIIDGEREKLEGRLQERYGWAKEQARTEFDNWYRARQTRV